MARRRFFVSKIRRGMAELSGPEAEHLVRVLRAEPGQQYEISDNRDVYLAQIEVARKSLVSFRVLEKLPSPEPGLEIHLFAALIKFDRFEWLIEKATELGVSSIQPFAAVRSERGLLQAAPKRLTRWAKIALEASQQAHRASLPKIEPPISFAAALETDAPIKLLLDESGGPPILDFLQRNHSASGPVAVLLGPEGGWTTGEREQAFAAGWQGCSLGATILRAETAATAALAVIQAAWWHSAGTSTS
jgi:16S rRNA (uracil1498-N3)-methyltransferase